MSNVYTIPTGVPHTRSQPHARQHAQQVPASPHQLRLPPRHPARRALLNPARLLRAQTQGDVHGHALELVPRPRQAMEAAHSQHSPRHHKRRQALKNLWRSNEGAPQIVPPALLELDQVLGEQVKARRYGVIFLSIRPFFGFV